MNGAMRRRSRWRSVFRLTPWASAELRPDAWWAQQMILS